MKWLDKLLYFFSIEKCYSDMEKEHFATFGCCDGLVGGDKETDYLQYQCVGCKFKV